MPGHDIAPSQKLVKSTGSRSNRRRATLVRFLLTTLITTTMITTGGFGTFPPNELTSSAAKLVSENFPAEIIQPINMVLAQASAPTLEVVEHPKASKSAPGIAGLVESIIAPIFPAAPKLPTEAAATAESGATLVNDTTPTEEGQLTSTPGAMASATLELSPTVTQATLTLLPTQTGEPSLTSTIAPTWTAPYFPPLPTNTKHPVWPTDTPAPTNTPKPSITPSPTLVGTRTNTPTRTGTATITLTRTITSTLTLTRTITRTPTVTATTSGTATITPTPTITLTLTVTSTPTESLTPSPSPTETETPTVTPTPTSCAVGYTFIASIPYSATNALQATWDGTTWTTTTIANWGSNTCNLPTYNNSGADITIMRRIADNTCTSFTVTAGGGVIWVSGDDTLGQCPVELYIP